MTADTSQTATALLTEHLQYTPLSLIDDIINSVNDLVYQGVSSLENGLFSTPPEKLGFSSAAHDNDPGSTSDNSPEYTDAKQEIEEGLHKLETLLESTVDKNFDRFEIYVLRNILSVPEDLMGWIRLSHYENLTLPTSDNVPTAESVQLLRRKAAASQNVTTSLLAESLQNEALLAQLKALISPRSQNELAVAQADRQPNLSFLNSSPSSRTIIVSTEQPTQRPLTTNTTFTLAQLPALRALLADLRPKLASLRSAEHCLNSARDERRQERQDYIEQRTRMHLERNQTAHSQNAMSVNGRKVDAEDVEALEKVASMFGVQ